MDTALVLAEHIEHWHGHGGWWALYPIVWFFLIVGAIYFFGRRIRRHHHQRPFQAGEAVLAERYARGEITEQEYRDRLGVLRQRPASP
jgi:putative membrane protein